MMSMMVEVGGENPSKVVETSKKIMWDEKFLYLDVGDVAVREISK